MTKEPPYYVTMLSIHGLIRGHDMELGRDADTGGQVKYVVEIARALAHHPKVGQVDLLTRRIEDDKVSEDYAQPIEDLGQGARIVRIPCGPKRYIRKELLWPYMDTFVDNSLKFLREERHLPDVIHGHYADAGYAGSQLAALLGIPFIFTGHSLGRDKQRRLLDQKMKQETIERRFKMSRRIEAEETALDHASFVVASTRQEIEKQYRQYDNYNSERMLVIPPGIDIERYYPPRKGDRESAGVISQIRRFLKDPKKPMILAVARPDQKKNLDGLVRAYGERKSLQELANLVIVAGTREDLRQLDRGIQKVLSAMLYLMDYYDLYGKMALPKHHEPDDIPLLYREAARSRGVFVNPAFVEPFGLTLIEAAASGVPVVATNDGGPQEILDRCKNGKLIDPENIEQIGQVLETVIQDKHNWKQLSKNGLSGVKQHYTWNSHVKMYFQGLRRVIVRSETSTQRRKRIDRRLLTMERLVISDIDKTLTGDKEGLKKLLERLKSGGDRIGFGVATGRSLQLTLKALKEWKIPRPDVLVTSVGSQLYYGPNLIRDWGWNTHISYRWRPDAIREAMKAFPGLEMQEDKGQDQHKISYYIDTEKAPTEKEMLKALRKKRINVKIIISHNMFCDVLPIRASKGLALKYFALKWNLPFEHVMVAGDSGNDGEMLAGNMLGVVVGNYSPELEILRDYPRVYFAQGPYAWGVLEGIDYYDLFGEVRIPDQENEYT
jgi:sucrose-phosphate synthase